MPKRLRLPAQSAGIRQPKKEPVVGLKPACPPFQRIQVARNVVNVKQSQAIRELNAGHPKKVKLRPDPLGTDVDGQQPVVVVRKRQP